MAWILEARLVSEDPNEWLFVANPPSHNEIEDLIRYYRDTAYRPDRFTYRLRNMETGEVIPSELFVDV